MGLFGKIKNILFEEDDEVEEMPVYTKEEVRETPKKMEFEEKPEPVVEEPIKATSNSRFRNVKRDIDLNFDESDVLGEIPGADDLMSTRKNEEKFVEPVVQTEKKEEKKSPFLSFDEDEFERLNSRINRNESRVRKEVKSVGLPANTARKANNNFSSTSTTKDTRIENVDRYKLSTSGSLNGGKKPFTPSPVISPVYGILDKNYKKDDIVDKQGGMKREKVVKPIVHKEEPVKKEEVFEVDIDKVRMKAYGELEDYEKNISEIETPALKNDKKEEIKVDVLDVQNMDVDLDIESEETIIDTVKNEIIEEPSIEEQLEDKFDVSSITQEELKEEPDIDEVVEKVMEKKQPSNEEQQRKARILNDLEKTSTLQILDDIEKELNSIKPITKSSIEDDEEEMKHKLENNDTLENDLFNLIDSMYEEGEEEEND